MGECTALELMEKVADQLKLARPSSILATDPQTRQLLEFLNLAGEEIAKAQVWEELVAEIIIEFGAPTTMAVDTVAADRTITVADSSAISAAGAAVWAVSGNGVQIGCRVASVTNATTIELTEAVDVTQSGATFTFTQDSFDLPADYYADVPQTQWDRRFQWRMIGPDTPQRDQQLRSGIVALGPRRRFRQTGFPKRFRIWPPPTASSDYPGTLVREYRSKYWVNSAADVRKRLFTANDDEHVYPSDQMLVNGVKWRYWQINGLAYADFRDEYYEEIQGEKAVNQGDAPVLSTNSRPVSHLISAANVQDGNFPSE